MRRRRRGRGAGAAGRARAGALVLQGGAEAAGRPRARARLGRRAAPAVPARARGGAGRARWQRGRPGAAGRPGRGRRGGQAGAPAEYAGGGGGGGGRVSRRAGAIGKQQRDRGVRVVPRRVARPALVRAQPLPRSSRLARRRSERLDACGADVNTQLALPATGGLCAGERAPTCDGSHSCSAVHDEASTLISVPVARAGTCRRSHG